jgi:hypothetical protein
MGWFFQTPTGANALQIVAQKLQLRNYQLLYPVSNTEQSQHALDDARADYQSLFPKVENPDVAFVLGSGSRRAIVSQGVDVVTLSKDDDQKGLLDFTGTVISDVNSSLAQEGPILVNLKQIVKGYMKWIFTAGAIASVLSSLTGFVMSLVYSFENTLY